MALARPIVYHIPVCPFSQRLEILLELKGRRREVDFHVVDITKPRPQWLLEKSRGITALPILETREERIVNESLVVLQYLEDIFPEPPVAQRDPYRRAVEGMLTRLEGPFVAKGYSYVMNQDPARREALRKEMLEQYAAQQVTQERIVKLYYDYAKGAGNGALLPGRTRSSFVFEPDWPGRPWPPRDKYGRSATDRELGLL